MRPLCVMYKENIMLCKLSGVWTQPVMQTRAMQTCVGEGCAADLHAIFSMQWHGVSRGRQMRMQNECAHVPSMTSFSSPLKNQAPAQGRSCCLACMCP